MIVLLKALLLFGFCVFCMLIALQFIFKDEYVKHFLYILEPDMLTTLYVKASPPPFDGWITTFVCCMIPLYNLCYLLYYYILIFSDNLDEIKSVVEHLKNGN